MTKVFVNLPTSDLDRSKAFYEALGFSINPLFTDENAACVVLGENIYFMVLTREYLATFTDKQIIDPATLDAEGRIRDLSGVIAEITPAQLVGEALEALKAIDPASLPERGRRRYRSSERCAQGASLRACGG